MIICTVTDVSVIDFMFKIMSLLPTFLNKILIFFIISLFIVKPKSNNDHSIIHMQMASIHSHHLLMNDGVMPKMKSSILVKSTGQDRREVFTIIMDKPILIGEIVRYVYDVTRTTNMIHFVSA